MSTRQVTRILSKDSVPSPDTVQRWCVSQGLDPCVAMADSPSMLDLVIIMMSALNEDEMRFVCKYVDELRTQRRFDGGASYLSPAFFWENVMRTYIGCKLIKAGRMSRHSFLRQAGRDVEIGQEEDQAGYHVIYPDEYESWSPLFVFENAYREVSDEEFKLMSNVLD